MSGDLIDYSVDAHHIEVDPEKIKRVKVGWLLIGCILVKYFANIA